MKIRKNDLVMVIAGKERKSTGKVIEVLDDGQRVRVEKLNIAKKHQRPTRQQPQGGIIDREAPIHVSNVMLLAKREGKPTRVGFKVVEGEGGKNKKMRYSRKFDEILD